MSSGGEIDLDAIYEFALRLGQDAGRLLNEAMLARCAAGPRASHVEKESAVDLVTQTDEGMSYLQTSATRLVRLQSWSHLPVAESHGGFVTDQVLGRLRQP